MEYIYRDSQGHWIPKDRKATMEVQVNIMGVPVLIPRDSNK
jgi:hypothetical protein